ncbi:MAG: hydrogenase expression/formation protein HypE [Synergistaceae bacterium]|nr:hydrogenase expression/formation protein HypE [Synergistaceae bacterium]
MEQRFTAITLGHGSGGRLTQQLTSSIIKNFEITDFESEDCAWINENMAVATDGFTVTPLSFPGGDIGKLAVCGSTNDLAVRGVRPDMLTLSLIIEEGLDMEQFASFMKSAADTCKLTDTRLIAGDTKVVPKGAADKLFITTCAIGKRMSVNKLGAANIREGDRLILTTSPGRHGSVLAAVRFGIEAPNLTSDCAPLWPALSPLLDLDGLRAMRDCTRGGLGTVLCEWAESSGLGFEIEERLLPKNESAASICDILGFDQLWLAGEGCALIAVSEIDAEECLKRLKVSDICSDAEIIGKVHNKRPRMAWMKTLIGGERVIDMPAGEILPRIC